MTHWLVGGPDDESITSKKRKRGSVTIASYTFMLSSDQSPAVVTGVENAEDEDDYDTEPQTQLSQPGQEVVRDIGGDYVDHDQFYPGQCSDYAEPDSQRHGNGSTTLCLVTHRQLASLAW